MDETAGRLDDPLAGWLAGTGNCLSNMHSHMLKQEAICCILAGAKPQLVCLANLCSQLLSSIDLSSQEAHTHTQDTHNSNCPADWSLMFSPYCQASFKFSVLSSYCCLQFSVWTFDFKVAPGWQQQQQLQSLCRWSYKKMFERDNYAIYDPWLHFICLRAWKCYLHIMRARSGN